MKGKTLLIPAALFLGASLAWAATYQIITQEAVIRKDRRFFAPEVARASYGEPVEQRERQGDWLRVSYKGREGWLHIGAVQEQRVRLSAFAGERAPESTREEVALAGRGFTPEVERAFREKNGRMRYDWVNQIQNYRIGESRLEEFIRSGNLREPGGGP
jgi:hypothetical protein